MNGKAIASMRRGSMFVLAIVLMMLSVGFLITDPDGRVTLAAETGSTTLYLPLVATACDLPAGRVLAPPIVFSSEGPVNFAAAQADLSRQGLALATNKVGFHVGIGGNRNGIGDAFRQLDSQGVPIILKSADDAGPVLEVVELAVASGVEHVAIYRRTGPGNDEYGAFSYDVPDYSLSPRDAAERHWLRHMRVMPPDLAPYRANFWLETVNEVDKSRAAWLADFAVETGRLALRDGFKWAAFGWSSGEPEPEHWRSPNMIAFLRLAAAHPDRLAIALHEYSYTAADVTNAYPYLVGRFHALLEAADAHQIARPTVLITEWGWEYQNIPLHQQALDDIAWAARLYAAYPEIKGAAIWYLGGGYGSIHEQAQSLIDPLADYSTTSYFGIEKGPGCLDPRIFILPTD